MFTGYDSGATGFDSSWQVDRTQQESGSQTADFSTANAGSQTSVSVDVQTQASTSVDEANTLVDTSPGSQESTLVYQPGLNEFLNRAVPMLLEALDAQELERQTKMHESDSEEESEGIKSSLVQCLRAEDVDISNGVQDLTLERGLKEDRDKQKMSVLGLSWSSGGNSLAVALGHVLHDEWCEHSGMLRVYTVKRSSEDTLELASSVAVQGCVSCVSWHSQVPALLAYATATGDIHAQSVKGDPSDSQQLTREAQAARPVTVLMWLTGEQTTRFVPPARGQRREKRVGASDQILVSAGSDGLVKIWQVNLNLGVLDVIVCYELYGASPGKRIAPDISCLDFMHAWSSDDTPPELRMPDDTFAVGTSTGELIVCKAKTAQDVLNSEGVDPVGSHLEPQAGCVIALAFCYRRAGVFASLGSDTQLRIYNVLQYSPLRVLYLDEQHTHFAWLPQDPMLLLLVGRTNGNTEVWKEQRDIMRIYSLTNGRQISVDGLMEPRLDSGDTHKHSVLPTYVTVNAKRSSRVAVGDHTGNTYVWDIPIPKSDNTTSRYSGHLPVPV